MAIRLGAGKKRPIQKGRNFVRSGERLAELATVPNAKRRKPEFNIIEGGCDEFPHAFVERVLASSRKGKKHRRFLAVDKKNVDLDALFSYHGVKKPFNTESHMGDILKCLDKLPPNSQHVIFGSFLINNLAGSHDHAKQMAARAAFMKSAKRVLYPGGRLILVSSIADTLYYRHAAEIWGLKLHAIPIPDALARTSPHAEIRNRGDPAYRERWLDGGDFVEDNPKEAIDAAVKDAGVSNHADLYSPTIFILRKPRHFFVGLRGAGSTSKSLHKAGE
jgi:hypothetical protein